MAHIAYINMNHFDKILKPLIIVAILIVTNCVCAQSYNSSSKKTIKYFEKARQEFLNKNYDNAIEILKSGEDINEEKAKKIVEGFVGKDLMREITSNGLVENGERLMEFEELMRACYNQQPKINLTVDISENKNGAAKCETSAAPFFISVSLKTADDRCGFIE